MIRKLQIYVYVHCYWAIYFARQMDCFNSKQKILKKTNWIVFGVIHTFNHLNVMRATNFNTFTIYFYTSILKSMLLLF